MKHEGGGIMVLGVLSVSGVGEQVRCEKARVSGNITKRVASKPE